MAYKRVILETANLEREKITAYLIETTGDTRAASIFLANLDKTIDSICEFPTMYAMSRMPELANKGYRVALTGTYILLYTFENETIYIAHIFHQRQDYAHLL